MKMNIKKIIANMFLVFAAVMMTACAAYGAPDQADENANLFESIEENMDSPDNKDDAKSDADGKALDNTNYAPITSVSSVSEYLELVDTSFIDDEKSYLGTEAIQCYDQYLSEISNLPENIDSHDDIRIALGLVDDDNVPELFVCGGTYSIYGVHIFKYDEATTSVVYLGEFSQYGFCRYAEKQGTIWSQYGNNGYFEMLFYKIRDNKTELIGRLLSTDRAKYADYSSSEEVNMEEVPTETPDDSYIISDEEFETRECQYMESRSVYTIGYDDMTSLIIK